MERDPTVECDVYCACGGRNKLFWQKDMPSYEGRRSYFEGVAPAIDGPSLRVLGTERTFCCQRIGNTISPGIFYSHAAKCFRLDTFEWTKYSGVR